MAEALNWVSRISSLGVMMVLPILGGRWLDNRYGTSYWGMLGLVLGLAIGAWQIALIAGVAKRRKPTNDRSSGTSRPNDKTDSKPPT